MGYTRKIAYEAANKIGADIYEIKAAERTEGILGFWWCGRNVMHSWDMPIKETTIDVSNYNKVIICSPIWVFGLDAPVQRFCRESNGKIKKAEYILLHHMGISFSDTANKMNALLGIHAENFSSICCRLGKVARVELHKVLNG